VQTWRRVVVVRPPPENAAGGPHPYEPPRPPSIDLDADTKILADRQRRARAKIRVQNERRRVCAELEQVASLVTYYGPRPLRAVPLAEALERWWAA
jgi:hypothetical protein